MSEPRHIADLALSALLPSIKRYVHSGEAALNQVPASYVDGLNVECPCGSAHAIPEHGMTDTLECGRVFLWSGRKVWALKWLAAA